MNYTYITCFNSLCISIAREVRTLKLKIFKKSFILEQPKICISKYFGKPKLFPSGHILIYRNMTYKTNFASDWDAQRVKASYVCVVQVWKLSRSSVECNDSTKDVLWQGVRVIGGSLSQVFFCWPSSLGGGSCRVDFGNSLWNSGIWGLVVCRKG